MSIPSRRAVLTVVWSIVVWVALWSDLSIANVLWGVVVGVATLWILPLDGAKPRLTVRPVALLGFLAYAGLALVKASGIVAWEVVTPRNRINQGIVEARLRTSDPGVVTLIANTISLTPGTLTLEVREHPPTLYVHIMHLRSIDEVRADIAALEDRALRAFPVHDTDAEVSP